MSEPLLLESLGATCDAHLIGKCVVDFLLVLIELFSLGVSAFLLVHGIGILTKHSVEL